MRTWDPGKVTSVFAGAIITGFSDGSMVKASRNVDTFTLVKGADGEGCRIRSRDKSGRVTFSLMQSSASNDILSAIAELDESTGAGIGPLLIKDLNGTLVVAAQAAWIVKPADWEAAKTLSDREWVLEANDLFIAGGTILT